MWWVAWVSPPPSTTYHLPPAVYRLGYVPLPVTIRYVARAIISSSFLRTAPAVTRLESSEMIGSWRRFLSGVQADAQKIQALARPGADFRGILADPAGEHSVSTPPGAATVSADPFF